MHRKFPRIYRALKRYGFSAAKAVQILLDAKRRDDHALITIMIVCRGK